MGGGLTSGNQGEEEGGGRKTLVYIMKEKLKGLCVKGREKSQGEKRKQKQAINMGDTVDGKQRSRNHTQRDSVSPDLHRRSR